MSTTQNPNLVHPSTRIIPHFLGRQVTLVQSLPLNTETFNRLLHQRGKSQHNEINPTLSLDRIRTRCELITRVPTTIRVHGDPGCVEQVLHITRCDLTQDRCSAMTQSYERYVTAEMFRKSESTTRPLSHKWSSMGETAGRSNFADVKDRPTCQGRQSISSLMLALRPRPNIHSVFSTKLCIEGIEGIDRHTLICTIISACYINGAYNVYSERNATNLEP